MSDKLNDTLRAWSKQNAASSDHLEQLSQRIHADAVRQRADHRFEEAHTSVTVGFWSRLGYAASGAAVALLTAFLYLRASTPAHIQDGSDRQVAIAAIPAAQIEKSTRLLQNMNELFGDGLRWVAESDGEVGLGVDRLPGGVTEDMKPMLVRLVVVSRTSEESGWAPIWNADIIMKGEDLIQVAPNKNADNRIALWVYPLSDGKISIDTDLELDVPLRLSSSRSMVVKQGEAREIMSITENGTEYKVFQSVSMLAPEGQGA
jgi:hypothetical protein